MKTLLFAYALLTCLSSNAAAHTCSSKTATCPIDGKKVEFCVTMSMTTFGSYYDFQEKGAIGSYYEESINACKKCYFSGFIQDFDTTFSESAKKEIIELLKPYKEKNLDEALECEIAAEIHSYYKKNNDKIANIYLIASYLIRSDKKQEERRKHLQASTITYLKKGLEVNEYEAEEQATIQYLIAELYRRRGEFDSSITYYDMALNNKNQADWLKKVATTQKALAIKKEEDNEI
jgi:uncharacterized protein (DUF2225 family)